MPMLDDPGGYIAYFIVKPLRVGETPVVFPCTLILGEIAKGGEPCTRFCIIRFEGVNLLEHVQIPFKASLQSLV